LNEGNSVGTIGDVSEGGDSVEMDAFMWQDCVLDDAAVGEDGEDLLEIPPFGLQEYGAILPERGDNALFNVLEMFHWFWSAEMFANMLQATNAYGNAYVRGWKNMTETELYAFLGIVTYLGCCSYPSRKEVWRAGIKGCEYIKRIMTLSRFDKICRAWHCRDQTVYTAATLKTLKEADPYWAVKDFVTELSNNYENR
jgi:hypothetical protein